MIHDVDIKRPTKVSTGGRGEAITSMETIWESVPVAIEVLSGRELTAARQIHANAEYRIRGYWLPDVDTRCVIYFGSRLLEVLSVVNVEERGHSIEILATERRSKIG